MTQSATPAPIGVRARRLEPHWLDVPADLETPVSAFLKIPGAGFLLESADGSEQVGRYSIIGVDEFERIEVRDGQVKLTADGRVDRAELQPGETPLDIVRRRLSHYDVAESPDLPPFFGGAVGYFSYDLVRHFEPVGDGPGAADQWPVVAVAITRTVVVFDHLRRTCRIVTLEEPGDGTSARHRLEQVASQLRGPLVVTPQVTSTPEQYESSLERDAFHRGVSKIQHHIHAGDAFQVVLSRRLSARTETDPFTIYRALRMLNPSPYMFFLKSEEVTLLGASPEALVRLTGDRCMTRPIAGTRPRRENRADDEAMARELIADPKERAEHVMLVDLGRNDLGRVCAPGTVSVEQMMEIERYSHVMHIVSSVEGRLREDRDAFDLLRAAFPAGTVSGAPKVRAMQIIDDLEPTRRGPYGGAVGYVSFHGNLDTCIAIRTLVHDGERLHAQAGAGVVADSDPESEFRETEAKLGAALRAVEIAAAGL